MTLFIVHIFYAHSPILPMIFLLILAIVFIISPFFNHIWFLHCTVVGLIYRCSNLSCPYWITFTSPRITKLTSLCHSFPFFSNRPVSYLSPPDLSLIHTGLTPPNLILDRPQVCMQLRNDTPDEMGDHEKWNRIAGKK